VEVGDLLSEKKARRDIAEAFIDSLRKQDGLISQFNVRFTFKNGMIIQA
jgi:hypothetical protein